MPITGELLRGRAYRDLGFGMRVRILPVGFRVWDHESSDVGFRAWGLPKPYTRPAKDSSRYEPTP